MGVVSGTENRGFGDKDGLPYHIKLWVVKVKPSRKRELSIQRLRSVRFPGSKSEREELECTG